MKPAPGLPGAFFLCAKMKCIMAKNAEKVKKVWQEWAGGIDTGAVARRNGAMANSKAFRKKKEAAFEAFMGGKTDPIELAAFVDCSAKTINKWIKDGKWDRIEGEERRLSRKISVARKKALLTALEAYATDPENTALQSLVSILRAEQRRQERQRPAAVVARPAAHASGAAASPAAAPAAPRAAPRSVRSALAASDCSLRRHAAPNRASGPDRSCFSTRRP